MALGKLDNQLNLKRAIIEVVAFFDLFDFPLTISELQHYLDKQVSLMALGEALETIVEISNKNGFFFLLGREDIITYRQKKYNYSLRKLKIAKKFSLLFSKLPFVQSIMLANSIGAFNLRDNSDIDFFIISCPRRIWLTRLYCAGLAALLNSRPSLKNKRDKICLSFYISSNALSLDSFKLKPFDPYFFYWLRSLFLLYNKNKTYEDFLTANKLTSPESDLINNYLMVNSQINTQPACLAKFKSSHQFEPQLSYQVGSKPGCQIKLVFSKSLKVLINLFEGLAKKFQLLIMATALKKAANNSTGVIINDKVLKLYVHDKRQEYLEKYGNKLEQILT